MAKGGINMAKKEYMVECRGMNFNEYMELEEAQQKYMQEHPEDTAGLGRLNVKYIMEHIYPNAPLERMTMGDVVAVTTRTMTLTQEVHEEEIKNLKPASIGSTDEQATAKTAAE